MIYGGFPIAADPQNMSWYPLAVILYLIPHSWNIFAISAYVIASSLAFALVSTLTKSRTAGLISGIIYGMSGFLMSHLGHTNMVHAAAWLPGIILCLEKLKLKFHAGWFTGCCVTIACSYLAGHPQMFVYSIGLAGAFVLFTGWHAPVGKKQYYLITVSALIIGIGLIAIQLLPALELTKVSLREKLNYTGFVAYSIKQKTLLTLLYPFIFGGIPDTGYGIPTYYGTGLTESSGYIGILSLMLVVYGLWQRSLKKEQVFFGFVTVISLLLVLGNVTPLAKLMFHIPGYNLFRAPSRHFLEFSLSISILAGFGIAALQILEHKQDKLKLFLSVVFIASLVLCCLIGINLFQHKMKLNSEGQIALPDLSYLPWKNLTIAVPLILTLINSIALLSLIMFKPKIRNKILPILVVILLIIDLGSFGWFCEWKYYSPSASDLILNSNFDKYKTTVLQSRQRILSGRGGLGVFDELPPNLSKLWKIPSVGGYNPLMLTRESNLLLMYPYGGVENRAFDNDNLALDLMATRYLFIPIRMLPPKSHTVSQADYVQDNIRWLKEDFALNMDFNNRNAEADFAPGTINATELGLVTWLSYSSGITNNTEVMRVIISTLTGETLTYPILAGKHTAEWAYERPDVKSRIKHQPAPVFGSFPVDDGKGTSYLGHHYLAIIPFSNRVPVSQIRVEWIAPAAEPNATIAIHKLSLNDASTGISYPITNLKLTTTLADTAYWKPVEQLGQTAVLENLRLMPRAWLVSKVLTLQPEQIYTAIQTSRLPDRTIFDPKETALIETPLAFNGNQPDTTARVDIVQVDEMQVKLDTVSKTSSFLVLSDIYYPGWKAIVNGKEQPIYQTNYILRGLLLKPGYNQVLFVYRPLLFSIGMLISIIALSCLVVITYIDWKNALDHTQNVN